MKFLRLLIKPKWQHKDAAVRRAAVAELADPELTAALPQILRGDADPQVRLAALRRLDEYELWRERSTADADGSVRSTARAAYVQRLMGTGRNVPALERRVAELDTLSGEELEQLAAGAADTSLRAAALERVKRPSLLIERTSREPVTSLLATTVRQLLTEVDALRPGSREMLGRMMEMLFFEMLRRYVGTLPKGGALGWLGALGDPLVSRSLQVIHADPMRSWTVEQIATASGTSRSVLAERFKAVLGQPPMQYVAGWRL